MFARLAASFMVMATGLAADASAPVRFIEITTFDNVVMCLPVAVFEEGGRRKYYNQKQLENLVADIAHRNRHYELQLRETVERGLRALKSYDTPKCRLV